MQSEEDIVAKKVKNILINKLHHLKDKDIFEKLLKQIEGADQSSIGKQDKVSK